MADKVRRETKGGAYDLRWAYRRSVSEFEALLLSDTAARMTNLEAVISAWRCLLQPLFEANAPVMLLLIANEGSDGR